MGRRPGPSPPRRRPPVPPTGRRPHPAPPPRPWARRRRRRRPPPPPPPRRDPHLPQQRQAPPSAIAHHQQLTFLHNRPSADPTRVSPGPATSPSVLSRYISNSRRPHHLPSVAVGAAWDPWVLSSRASSSRAGTI